MPTRTCSATTSGSARLREPRRRGRPARPIAEGGGGLDWVTNALDSVPARKYVDHRCVFFKPLLGGTGHQFNSMAPA